MATRSTPLVFIEALESRIAPSVVIAPGGRVAHYTDLDGDRVTITVSKGRLSADDFVMSSDGATVPGGEALVMIDFSDDNGEFNHANLSVIAKRSRLGGDAHVNVGFVNAGDGMTDLGRIFIDGDLGKIVAGDSNTSARSPGVKVLFAQEFSSAGGSDVIGGIAKLHVAADFSGGSLVSNHAAGGITISSGVTTSGAIFTTSNLNLGGTLSLTGTTNSAGLIKTGIGTLDLNSAGTFTGTTNLSGGTLTLNGGLAGIGSVNLNAGSNIVTGTTNTLGGTLTLNGGLTVNTGSVFTGTGTVNLTTSEAITNANVLGTLSLANASFTSELIKSGSGTLTLGAGVVFNGTTTVNAGTLIVTNPTGTLGANRAITVNGGTLVLNGANGNLLLNNTDALALPTGAVVKVGEGTLTLGANNVLTGLTVAGGPLNLGGAVLTLRAGGLLSGALPVAEINLTNLDPATAPAGATKFEIEVGHNDVSIVQNRAAFDNLIHSGWVVGAPTLGADGKVISIKLTKPGAVTISAGNFNVLLGGVRPGSIIVRGSSAP